MPLIINGKEVQESLELASGSGNLASGTSLRLYNTADQVTNYERLRLYWTGDVATITTEKGGTGTLRVLKILGGLTTGTGVQIASGTSAGSGTILLGHTTTGTNADIEITRTDGYNISVDFRQATVNALGSYPALRFHTARGTYASPAVVAADDGLFLLVAKGYDSNSWEVAAQILIAVDGTPGDGDMPGRIVFQTTPDASVTPAEVARMDNSGKFRLNRASDGISQSFAYSSVDAATIRVAKVSKAHDSDLFNAADLTDSVVVWAQPAGTVLLCAKMRLATQFAAVDMTDLDVTIGDAGDNDGLMLTTVNMTSDAVNTEYTSRGAYWDTSAEGAFWYANAATNWTAYATAVGANLSTTSAGQLDFYFTYLQP